MGTFNPDNDLKNPNSFHSIHLVQQGQESQKENHFSTKLATINKYKGLVKAITFLSLSLAITFFFSGPVGFAITKQIARDSRLFLRLKNYRLTKNTNLYRYIGIDIFVWFVKNVFSGLNKEIRIRKRLTINEIDHLKEEMTVAELTHVIAFILVLPLQGAFFLVYGFNSLFYYLVLMNILFNLYPVLLQERNKARITRLEF